MSKKLFLVVNPCSGRARMKTELLNVVQILSDAGYDVTVYPTKCRGDAADAVSRLEDDFEAVVCCGGDGTLNETITGLMHNGNRFNLGYIPSGTLNEWSSGLHIPRDIRAAARNIVSGRIIPLDIGRFNDRFFSYTASFGAFTEASYSAPQDVKNVLGQAAYFFEGIKSLGNIKPVHLEINSDNGETEGDFLFGAVTNALSVGGVLKLDESIVQLNDGLFETVLIHNPESLAELQVILDAIIRRDLHRPGIEFFHTSRITVKSDAPLAWTLDGEYADGGTLAEIENLNEQIKLIVPEK